MAYLSFTAHPASVGETYSEHLQRAGGFGVRMVTAGLAFLVNGLFPFLFTRTGPGTVASLYDSMVSNRKRVGDQQGTALSSTRADVPTQPINGHQARSKAVAWWIEFANGRHSSPYPSEAEARAVGAAQDSAPLWLVSSEGLRVPISSPGTRGRLRLIEVGLATFVAVLVCAAVYWNKHTPAPGELHARTTAPPVPRGLAKTPLALRLVGVSEPRKGGRETGLEMLISQILNTQAKNSRSLTVERVGVAGRRVFR